MSDLERRRAQAELYCSVVLNSPGLNKLFEKYVDLLDDEIIVSTNTICSCNGTIERHPLNPEGGQSDKLEEVEEFIRRGMCTCGSEVPSGIKKNFGSVNLVHAAAGYGNMEALALLAKYKCDFNAKTTYFRLTPLMYVVRNSVAPRTEVIDFLLSQDVDVNDTCNPDNMSVLMYAVTHRRSYVVGKLLQVPGIRLNHQNRRQETALMFAVRHEVEDAFEMLVEAGADPNLTNIRGNSVIFEAFYKDPNYLALLVENGANVNIRNKRGDTPLLLAVQTVQDDDATVVKYLLENGADPNLDSREYPLLILAAIVGSESASEALIEHKADIHKTNLQGYNALHVAAWNGHLKITEMLLKAGITPDLQTGDKNTALSLTAHGNFLPVVNLLLPLGCNVNNADKDKDTPLHYASYNGNEEMVRVLLEHEADPNAVSDLKVTALWNAVYKRNKAMVKMLISRNVALEVKSRGGNQHSNSDNAVPIYPEPRSPLYVAADRNSTEIALLLVSAGYNIYQEEWLIMGEFPPGAVENHTLCSLLTKFATTPPRLFGICRNYLRQKFGLGVHKVVKSLDIPLTLKNSLTLSDLVS